MVARQQSAGARANTSGSTLENMIAAALETNGIRFERQVVLDKPSIYGLPLKVDFLIRPYPRIPHGLIIEAKWQDTGGSIDEKFPYLWLNIMKCFPYPAVVVTDGSGARPGAIAWLKAQKDGIKLLHVFTIEEFTTWVNRKL